MNTPHSTPGFIRRGLQLFRSGFPERFVTVGLLIEKIPGIYIVGEEQFCIRANNGKIFVGTKKMSGPRVKAQLTHHAIISLVDGSDTLQNLLSREELVLYADSEALLILSEAAKLLISSAIWSASLRELFEDYRQWVYAQHS